MVVLANPGEPDPAEDAAYAARDATSLADAAWTFTGAIVERTVPVRSVTLRVLVRHLAEDVLQCSPAEVLDHVVITNVVRCSTPRKFGSYGKVVQREIGSRCASRHLLREIDHWRPRLVVACGKPAHTILGDLRRRGTLDVELAHTLHPSALGDYIEERREQFRAIGERFRAGNGTALPLAEEGPVTMHGAVQVISTQEQWLRVCGRFGRSGYRPFSREYAFDPASRLRLTGVGIRDVLPRSRLGGKRWTIFARAIQEGPTIAEINRRAREVGREVGGKPEHGADVFLALRAGYATLER